MSAIWTRTLVIIVGLTGIFQQASAAQNPGLNQHSETFCLRLSKRDFYLLVHGSMNIPGTNTNPVAAQGIISKYELIQSLHPGDVLYTRSDGHAIFVPHWSVISRNQPKIWVAHYDGSNPTGLKINELKFEEFGVLRGYLIKGNFRAARTKLGEIFDLDIKTPENERRLIPTHQNPSIHGIAAVFPQLREAVQMGGLIKVPSRNVSSEVREELLRAVEAAGLTARQQQIMVLRFGLDNASGGQMRSLKQVAAEAKSSDSSSVRAMLNPAIERMRMTPGLSDAALELLDTVCSPSGGAGRSRAQKHHTSAPAASPSTSTP